MKQYYDQNRIFQERFLKRAALVSALSLPLMAGCTFLLSRGNAVAEFSPGKQNGSGALKKRFLRQMTLVLASALSAALLAGCGASGREAAHAAPAAQSDTLRIVATIFPEYDWVRQILGDKADDAELTLLLDNGVDLHSYQPTAEDIRTVADCDLFIYVGGESDEWVQDALAEATNPDMRVIDLLAVLGTDVKEEEVVEGMEAEEEEEEEEEGPEYDEHVWLSLRNAEILCAAITDELAALDPDNADAYRANLAAYQQQLGALDSEYAQAVQDAKYKTLLFGDRFPFRYLADDYGLKYYAAFVGCSAETEASFETVAFLAQKVDALGLGTVLTIERSDQKIARTVVENTAEKNQQILTLDSMQSTTLSDVEAGASYLSVMQDNLTVLRQALN